MDYEHLPGDGPLDETDLSLRAYLARLSDRHLGEYDPAWSDERVVAWDGNFRCDGALMLVCCERDIDVADFRRALKEHLRHRGTIPRQQGNLTTIVLLAATLLLSAWKAQAEPIARVDDPWPKHVVFAGGGNMTVVGADFTGDRKIDVISTFAGSARLFTAPDWKETVIHQGPSRNWTCIHSEIMDADGDGDTDYIGAIPTQGVFWLENPGGAAAGGWTYHNIDDEIHGIHCTLRADVNGDGQPDLLVNNFENHGAAPNSLTWLARPANPRGAASWTRHVLAQGDAPGGSHYFGFGDVDGDGRADVCIGAKGQPFTGGNWFAWWKRPENAMAAWPKQLIAENQIGATNIQPADLNGDKVVDFFATRGHGQGVVWFEGPTWKPHEVDPTLDGPHCLQVHDIDGDGDLDAATCAKLDKLAVWYENDGRGRFTPHVVGKEQSAYDIRILDMDADGDADFLIAGEFSANIVWYENKAARRSR